MIAQALRKIRRRGFSLVEMALAMAVLGVMLSGLIIPVGNELRRKGFVATHAEVADAIESIVGYAAIHHSPGMLLSYGGLNTSLDNIYGERNIILPQRAVLGLQYLHVPAGRPYLPCPDITNDGHEDRYPTVNPRDDPSRPDLDFRDDDESRPVYFDSRFLLNTNPEQRLDFGECVQHSGNLPWKTLGLAPGDAWGNLYTYIVHPNFAGAAFGFDQHTFASSFPPYGVADEASGQSFSYGNIVGQGRFGRTALYVCDAFIDGSNCTNVTVGPDTLRTASASPPVNRIQYYADDLLASNIAPLSRAGLIGRLSSATNALVADGLPFAVISHGANARWARRANGTGCVRVLSASATDQIRFREAANAHYGTCPPALSVTGGDDPRGFDDFTGSGFPSQYETGEHIGQVTFEGTRALYDNYGAIFSAGRGGHALPGRTLSSSVGSKLPIVSGQFDDVVGWLTRRELADRLYEASVFPVDTYPGVLLEGLPAFLSGFVR